MHKILIAMFNLRWSRLWVDPNFRLYVLYYLKTNCLMIHNIFKQPDHWVLFFYHSNFQIFRMYSSNQVSSWNFGHIYAAKSMYWFLFSTTHILIGPTQDLLSLIMSSDWLIFLSKLRSQIVNKTLPKHRTAETFQFQKIVKKSF